MVCGAGLGSGGGGRWQLRDRSRASMAWRGRHRQRRQSVGCHLQEAGSGSHRRRQRRMRVLWKAASAWGLWQRRGRRRARHAVSRWIAEGRRGTASAGCGGGVAGAAPGQEACRHREGRSNRLGGTCQHHDHDVGDRRGGRGKVVMVSFLPVTFEVEKGCSMLNSCLSWAQSLSHCCRVRYARPAQQCVADSSALGVAVWWLRRAWLYLDFD